MNDMFGFHGDGCLLTLGTWTLVVIHVPHMFANMVYHLVIAGLHLVTTTHTCYRFMVIPSSCGYDDTLLPLSSLVFLFDAANLY